MFRIRDILAVLFLCITFIDNAAAKCREQTFGMCQGQRGFIKCTGGTRIKVISALYGRTSKDICPTGKGNNRNCRMRNVDMKVRWNCNGFKMCHLEAGKTLFGNPCPGQSKYLIVKYTCEKTTAICDEGSPDTIAFSAYASRHWTGARNTFIDVVYDKIYFNVGNAYNARTGFFKAPSAGLYVFSWTTLVRGKTLFDSQIEVNGKAFGRENCNIEGNNSSYESCSNTTPLILKKGDRVHIKKRAGNAMIGDQWSSFKGWKVY